MAAKKAKTLQKETKVADTGKEGDEEFLKRLAKMREEASKKASEEISSPYSKEIEEFREKGKQVGKDLEEIEECKRIVEEFKGSPPIMEAVYVNDVAFEHSCKDSNIVKKIELLKKHGFAFLHATKRMSTFPINFKTFGKAYVKRGMQKIPLPGTSKPPVTGDIGMGSRALDPKNFGFRLKDGDILGTERGGYIYDIEDVEQNSENHFNDVFIFPESELRISIRTDTTHPEPEFMEPSKVPDVIKRLSSNTVNTDTIAGTELIRGLFQIHFLRKGRDVNKLIALPHGYPSVEFKSTSAMGIKILEETVAKARKVNPKMAELLEAQYSTAKAETRARSGGICDDMAAFIELNQNGALVLFGTPNVVVHKDIGKETKKIDPRKKITLTRSALYETDCSKSPDPRIDAAIKIPGIIRNYVGLLAAKKECENAPSKGIDKEMDKKTYEEDLQMLKDAEELGSDELIEMMKEKIKLDGMLYRTGASQKEVAVLEEQRKKALEYAEKNIELFKRQIESGLPPYNSPNENDKV